MAEQIQTTTEITNSQLSNQGIISNINKNIDT